jgi:hypothetical protein
MKPTIENMETYYPKYGNLLVIVGDDGGEYSANPFDYFWMTPEDSLTGEMLVKLPPTYVEPE